MHKPAIMTVDDDPVVLKAIERDLHSRYGRDYQIIAAGSGSEALGTVLKLKQRNSPLALLVVDQRMPGMSGTEFLARAVKFFPDVKKVLLTAYSDTEAAIQSINEIGLDFYMLKPWEPPQEKLYPLLDELLSDWMALMEVPYDGIRVVGAQWSTASHKIKDVLNNHQIPYQWLDIEANRLAKNLLDTVKNQDDRLPVIFFPDGSLFIEPEMQQLAEKLELETRPSVRFYDLIIIGGGAAGLGALLSSGSAGMRTLLVEAEDIGGKAAAASHIETRLGFPVSISGADLVTKAAALSKMSAVDIVAGQSVKEVHIDGPFRYVVLNDKSELSCHALLVATGTDRTRLEQPGVEKFLEGGVFYDASPADMHTIKDQHVIVIGWDDSAGQAALSFAGNAAKVTILSTKRSLSEEMSSFLVKQISSTDNIQVHDFIEFDRVDGSDKVESITFTKLEADKTITEPADAVFIFSDVHPRSDIVEGIVDLDRKGFILAGSELMAGGKPPQGWTLKRDPSSLETSVPGIFAAGDVRHGSVKRVGDAFTEGAAAVQLIQQYLKTM